MHELDLLADTASAILADTPDKEKDAGWSPTAWRTLEEAGVTRVGVPDELGGSGGATVDVAVLLHAVGAAAAPVPLAEATLLGGWLLTLAGLPLPDGVLTSGRGGQASRTSTGWRLTGSVSRVPWATVADHVALLATSEEGQVAALVPVSACEPAPGRNLAGESRDTLNLPDVLVGGDRTTPLPPQVADVLAMRGAASRVVLMAGAAQAALAQSVRYASERYQFGRPISRFQAVQQSLARLAGEVAALQSAAHVAVRAIEDEEHSTHTDPVVSGDAQVTGRGGPSPRWVRVAAAKARAGRAAGEAAAVAHQVHGAMGVTWEHHLRRLTTRLWAWRDEHGSDSEWAGALGSWAVGTGPASLWLALGDDDETGATVESAL